MRTFEELISEARAADVTGRDFSWLDGRATEQRPPWGYAKLLAQRLSTAHAALDIDTGGGEGHRRGPASAFELIEFFLGPQPENRRSRHPDTEVHDAEAAGLALETLRTARCRMEFYDIGAVIWILRKCPWWAPDFSVEDYLPQLRELDARLRRGESFVAHSTRHLIVARTPD